MNNFLQILPAEYEMFIGAKISMHLISFCVEIAGLLVLTRKQIDITNKEVVAAMHA
jgi:hypothetical protein